MLPEALHKGGSAVALPAIASFFQALYSNRQRSGPALVVLRQVRAARSLAISTHSSHDASRAQLNNLLGRHAENRRKDAIGILAVVGTGAAEYPTGVGRAAVEVRRKALHRPG